MANANNNNHIEQNIYNILVYVDNSNIVSFENTETPDISYNLNGTDNSTDNITYTYCPAIVKKYCSLYNTNINFGDVYIQCPSCTRNFSEVVKNIFIHNGECPVCNEIVTLKEFYINKAKRIVL